MVGNEYKGHHERATRFDPQEIDVDSRLSFLGRHKFKDRLGELQNHARCIFSSSYTLTTKLQYDKKPSWQECKRPKIANDVMLGLVQTKICDNSVPTSTLLMIRCVLFRALAHDTSSTSVSTSIIASAHVPRLTLRIWSRPFIASYAPPVS